MRIIALPTGHVDVKYINDTCFNEEVTQNCQIKIFGLRHENLLCSSAPRPLLRKRDFLYLTKGNLNKKIGVLGVRGMLYRIHFWELSDSVRFSLKEEFMKKLFSDFDNLYELANKLGISYSYLIHLKNNCYTIPKKLLIKLAKYSGFYLNEIEKNIINMSTRAGHSIIVQFPIKCSGDVASLIGHVFGDGCITNKKRQFEYSNTNPELINQVETIVYNLFKIKPYTKTPTRIIYPTIIGEILLCFGAPKAPKLYNDLQIPGWIFQNKTYKRRFLRALFDDDGSVMYSDKYFSKSVNLYQTKHISIKANLINLLNQINLLLADFNIFPGAPLISRKYMKQDGQHVVAYINITDQGSIKNFYNLIGLTKGGKFNKLHKLILRNVTCKKKNSRQLSDKVLIYLEYKDKATTKEISIEMKSDRAKILKKLIQLESNGFIMKDGKIANNRSYFWKTKEVTQCES